MSRLSSFIQGLPDDRRPECTVGRSGGFGYTFIACNRNTPRLPVRQTPSSSGHAFLLPLRRGSSGRLDCIVTTHSGRGWFLESLQSIDAF